MDDGGLTKEISKEKRQKMNNNNLISQTYVCHSYK